jgi:hypothetical protein
MLNDLLIVKLVMQTDTCAEVFESSYTVLVRSIKECKLNSLSFRCFSGQSMS